MKTFADIIYILVSLLYDGLESHVVLALVSIFLESFFPK